MSKSQETTENLSLINSKTDENGHGTMMYSIIKGYKHDILGISPDANIFSIKILGEDESISPNKIAEAIDLAIKHKATIINLSVASYKYNERIAESIKKANDKNITIVASSGDYSDVEMMFPANMKEVISVGALDKKSKPLDMTSGAEFTTINAPGKNVETLGLDNKVFASSGTSQATAIISGYIALLRDYGDRKDINISNNDIKKDLNLIKNGKQSYSTIFELY